LHLSQRQHEPQQQGRGSKVGREAGLDIHNPVGPGFQAIGQGVYFWSPMQRRL
jgi:hypothetical protein